MKKQAENIRRIGLTGNSEKASFAAVVQKAARLISAAGCKVFSDAITADLAHLKGTICPDVASLSRAVDLLLVFGGDGTMLRAAREMTRSRTPILGVNVGGLGFLTAVPSTELSRALKHVWQGEFKFESRTLIEANALCQKQFVRQRALNDLVISRGTGSRLIELAVSVDGEFLTRYRCDGLIVSSPTGSTAYSLAAGGALVFPTADVFELTPICPHTLSNRSIILPLTAVIDVRVISSNPVSVLSADGQVVSELSAGDIVKIRQSRQTVRIMHLANSSFFEALRRKLQWRGAYL